MNAAANKSIRMNIITNVVENVEVIEHIDNFRDFFVVVVVNNIK